MKTAKRIKTLTDWKADAALYQLSEPYEGNEFVIASAIVAPFTGPETYLFPSDAEGRETSMSEMPGSYRGGLSHAVALENAGYAVTP